MTDEQKPKDYLRWCVAQLDYAYEHLDAVERSLKWSDQPIPSMYRGSREVTTLLREMRVELQETITSRRKACGCLQKAMSWAMVEHGDVMPWLEKWMPENVDELDDRELQMRATPEPGRCCGTCANWKAMPPD